MIRVPILHPGPGQNQEIGFATMQVIEWLVGVGDVVKRGQVIVVVSWDKGDLEIEPSASGMLVEICYQAGGGPIALTEVLGYIEAGT